MTKPDSSWITDEFNGNTRFGLKADNVLFSGSSHYQDIQILDTPALGRVLVLDGMIAQAEKDEYVYSEMLVHVPLFSHPHPKSVLVIGGADGSAAREAMRHESVREIVVAEKDEMLVEACVRYLPSGYALDDLRVETVFKNPEKFILSEKRKFDVILVDFKNRSEIAKSMSDISFYLSAINLLDDGGIMIVPGLSPFLTGKSQAGLLENLKPHFERIHLYCSQNFSCPGGVTNFGFASMRPCPFSDFDQARFDSADLDTFYYNKDVHRSSFILPEFVKKTFKEILDPVPV